MTLISKLNESSDVIIKLSHDVEIFMNQIKNLNKSIDEKNKIIEDQARIIKEHCI